ncbi:uncharacterized protein LOC143253698 isoform X5 [Tachypleus tridentatus]
MVIVLYLLGLPMVTELLDLFMTWDWATYFHDYGQENSKYLRVNPQVAVVLLEKRQEKLPRLTMDIIYIIERNINEMILSTSLMSEIFNFVITAVYTLNYC